MTYSTAAVATMRSGRLPAYHRPLTFAGAWTLAVTSLLSTLIVSAEQPQTTSHPSTYAVAPDSAGLEILTPPPAAVQGVAASLEGCPLPLKRVDTTAVELDGRGRLSEIHVRNAFKGSVQVKDAAGEDARSVRVELIKEAVREEKLNIATLNKAVYETVDNTIILVLSVIEQKRPSQSSTGTLLVLITASVSVVVICLGIVVWAVEKRLSRRRRYGGGGPSDSPASAAVAFPVPCCQMRLLHDGVGRTSMTAPPPPAPSTAVYGSSSTDDQLSCSGDQQHRLSVLVDQMPSQMEMCNTSSGRNSNVSLAISSSSVAVVHASPPPPPPDAASSNADSDFPPPPPPMSTVAGGAGSTGSPRQTAIFRATLLLLCTVLTAVSGVVAVSSCQHDVDASRVTVVLYIPSAVQLDKLRIFFKGRHKNDVMLNDWSQGNDNDTVVQIHDLDESGLKDSLSCPAGQECPVMSGDALLGNPVALDCDPAKGNCVCRRGFVLKNSVCVDYDECAEAEVVCGDGSTCENLNGSYMCHCQPGYFRHGDTCQACSPRCVSGFYEVQPCSANYDRTCRPCTECRSRQYEARLCRHNQDRLCLHAAHPLLSAENQTVGVYIEGLRITSSPNLFLENLHNTRNLETTYYVTDVKQQTDFFWYRDSGIRINIGLQNVNIVPAFEDVDHAGGDNNFVTGSPQSDDDKDWFSGVVRRQYRYPMPDYYTVTLELSRDRTTNATLETCRAQASTSGQSDTVPVASCPPGVSVGEQFVRRSLNDQCDKMSGVLVRLKPAANSVVCTDESDLLRRLFNMTPSAISAVSFPSKKCRTSQARCEQCLHNDLCQVADLFEQRCCHVDCYKLADCKQAASVQCSKAAVECATGDAYRYTLQPVFRRLRHAYSCHVRRRRPEMLYQLWFYVTVPGTSFETPRIQRRVDFRDGATSGSHVVTSFLTVEHTTGMRLDDELILTGRGAGDRWDYRVRSANDQLSAAALDRSRRFDVRSLSSNIHVVPVQFTEPFAYSTSTWINDCAKNVSKFVPAAVGGAAAGAAGPEGPGAQSLPTAAADDNSTDGKTVIVTTRTSRAPYEYVVQSVDNPPHMKFIIPANVSVLHWWFHEKSSRLIIDDSFRSSLALSPDERFWEIQLTGDLTECPGYLSITINDRLELEEIFHYDILVSCPAHFNLSFLIPNWTSRPDRTYDVELDDSHTKYRVFLSNLAVDNVTQTCSNEADGEHRRRVGVGADDRRNSGDTIRLLLVVLGTSSVLLFVFLCVASVLELSTFQSTWKFGTKLTDSGSSDLTPTDAVGIQSSGCCNGKPLSGSRRRTVVLCVHVLLRLVFCLSLTFTVTSTVFHVWQRRRLDDVAVQLLPDFRRPFDSAAADAWRLFDEHTAAVAETEVSRRRGMQSACDGYTSDLADLLRTSLDEFSSSNSARQASPSSSGSVDRLRVMSVQLGDDVERFAADVRQWVDGRLKRLARGYRDHVQRTLDNAWLMYPQGLFNRTAEWPPLTAEEDGSDPRLTPGALSDSRLDVPLDKIAFAKFLQQNEFVEVGLWRQKFEENFDRLLTPLFTVLSSYNQSHPRGAKCTTQHPSSSLPVTTSGSSFADATSLDRMNSTRFIGVPSSSVTDWHESVTWLRQLQQYRVRPPHHADREQELRGTYWGRDIDATEPQIPPVDVDSLFPVGDLQSSATRRQSDVGHRKPTFEDVLADIPVSWDALKVIFLGVDVLLIVFYLSRVCAVAQKLSTNGFRERVTPTLKNIVLRSSLPASFDEAVPGRPADFDGVDLSSANNKNSVVLVMQSVNCVGAAGSGIDSDIRENGIQLTGDDGSVGGETATAVGNHRCQSSTGNNCRDGNDAAVLWQRQTRSSSTPSVDRLSRFKPQPVAPQKDVNFPITKSSSSSTGTSNNSLLGTAFRICSRLVASRGSVAMICVTLGLVVCVHWLALSVRQLLRSSPSSTLPLLLRLTGFTTSIDTLRFQSRLCNDFVDDVTRQDDLEVGDWYGRHMAFEMRNLQGLLLHYNAVRARGWQQFRADVCSLDPATCNVTSEAEPSDLQLLMLPCNYFPIPAKLFPVCEHTRVLTSLIDEFSRLLLSGGELVDAFATGLLVACATATVVCFAEKLALRMLRAIRVFPVTPTYVLSSAHARQLQLRQPEVESSQMTTVDRRSSPAVLARPNSTTRRLPVARSKMTSPSRPSPPQSAVVAGPAAAACSTLRGDGVAAAAVCRSKPTPSSSNCEISALHQLQRSQFSETKV